MQVHTELKILKKLKKDTYIRETIIDQKLKENPHIAVETVHTDKPTPISLKESCLKIY